MSTLNINGSVACQDNSSLGLTGWRREIEELSRAFEEMQAAADLRARARARERFYGRYLDLSRSVAASVLKDSGRAPDVWTDAEDVSGEVVKNLLRQEAQGSGVFIQETRSPAQLRGYLSNSIWKGCRQRVADLLRRFWTRKVSLCDGLTGALATAMDSRAYEPWRKLALEEAIENLQESQRGRYRKLPAGVTPLDLVLDVGMGKALAKGVPVRTLQRYMNDARRELAARLDRRMPQRESRHNPPEPEM